MMKRNEQGDTSSRLGVDEFGSTSSIGVGEVDPASLSVSHPETEATPSPSHETTSNVEPVDSPSRAEVEEVGASSSSRAYLALLCLAELRCRRRLELLAFCLATNCLHVSHKTISH